MIDGGEDAFLLQWACLEASIPAFEKQQKRVILVLAIILESKDIIIAVFQWLLDGMQLEIGRLKCYQMQYTSPYGRGEWVERHEKIEINTTHRNLFSTI